MSSDAHVDDKYYTRFISPASMLATDSGTLASLNTTFPVITCPTAVLSTGVWAIDWPEYWRRGRLAVRQYWRHANAVGSAAFVASMLVQSQAVGEPAGRGTIITAKTLAITLGSGGALTQVVTFDWESTSIESRFRSSGEQEILGGNVGRLGTDGSDDMALDMYCLGVKLTWKPEPSSA